MTTKETIIRTTSHRVEVDKDGHEKHTFTFEATNEVWKASVEFYPATKHWSKVEFGPDVDHSPIWYTTGAFANHFKLCSENWLNIQGHPTPDFETSVMYELTEFVKLLGNDTMDTDLATTFISDIDTSDGSL
jgi:hypothetical protein